LPNKLLSFLNLNELSPGLNPPNRLPLLLFLLAKLENSDDVPTPAEEEFMAASFFPLSPLFAVVVVGLNEKVKPFFSFEVVDVDGSS